MRVYKTQYSYYCGVDLHSRSLFVKVLHPNDESLSQAQAAEWSLLLKEEVGHVLIAVLEEWVGRRTKAWRRFGRKFWVTSVIRSNGPDV